MINWFFRQINICKYFMCFKTEPLYYEVCYSFSKYFNTESYAFLKRISDICQQNKKYLKLLPLLTTRAQQNDQP